jgi:LysR family transcriptional regulator, glycine cleavage system transcriptional activator
MHALRRRLPSLNYLFAIEAVGRHLSFTDAAEELGISQPAVSKAIRTTEEALGFLLFERDRRGLKLTANGKVIFREAKHVLNQLLKTVRELTGDDDSAVVRACFSSSFVALWMLPRLPEFSKRHPNIALHLDESDSDKVHFAAKDLDFSARLGDGMWDDVRSWLLTAERVGAVASPDYVARNPRLKELAVLAQANLIHVDEPKRVRIGWNDWFASLHADQPLSKASLTVSDYHSAVDAAAMGQGVALGWEHLVRGKVEQGQLQWIGEHMVETGLGIYLVEPIEVRQEEHISSFRDWIVSQFS